MYQFTIFIAEKRRKINIFIWNTQIFGQKIGRLLKNANSFVKKGTFYVIKHIFERIRYQTQKRVRREPHSCKNHCFQVLLIDNNQFTRSNPFLARFKEDVEVD